MKPTPKSPVIEALLTVMSGGVSRQDAMRQMVCTCCHRPVRQFKDALSEKEYTISGLCQSCQDNVFGSDDE